MGTLILAATVGALVVVGLILLGMIGLAISASARDVQAMRERNREREAEKAAQRAERTAFTRLWFERTTTGTIIDLHHDGRIALAGKKIKYLNEWATSSVMRRDVYDWCRANLSHDYGFVPVTARNENPLLIWFENTNDAMYFKMVWY